MFEKFTGEARQVVVLAQEEARRLNHNYIGTEHVLLAFMRLPGEVAAVRALRSLGFTAEGITADVEQIIGRGQGDPPSGHIPFTPRAKKVLELSLREALGFGVTFIGPEHLLLGIVREGSGVGAKVLTKQKSLAEIRKAVTAVSERGSAGAAPVRTPAAEQALALAEQIAAGAPTGSHHILEALTRSEDSMAGKALAALQVTTEQLVEQVDALDIAQTTDITPEQAAAASIRWEADEQGVRIVTTDPDTVAKLRALIEQAGGELTGAGPLAGPFIGLHRAIQSAVSGIDTALNPAEETAASTTLRDRLRRRLRPDQRA